MDQSINNLTSIKFIEYQTKLQLIICTCIKLIYFSVRYKCRRALVTRKPKKCLSTDQLWLANLGPKQLHKVCEKRLKHQTH